MGHSPKKDVINLIKLIYDFFAYLLFMLFHQHEIYQVRDSYSSGLLWKGGVFAVYEIWQMSLQEQM